MTINQLSRSKNPEGSRGAQVRFAPSPTGRLHLGSARTALFNYVFAKKNNGKFILRLEDTDIKRSKKKYEKDILDSLRWLGLNWDEGPYRQSERTEIYQKYIKKLLDSHQAFWCSHAKEELEAEKNDQMSRGESPRHICGRFNLPHQNVGGSTSRIIRFRCPKKKLTFTDLIRGRLEFDAGLLGDIGLARDEKTPLYNLSNVIDDYEMKITHVIRGEDHISNTQKQILLQKALGLPSPKYGHLPLILGPDRTKLSKRHGAASVGQYKKQGYLPKALINFMALLGWNPGAAKEIFSLEELIKEFSLERVQKGGAVFNLSRLDWFNGYYIRKMDLDELTEKCAPYFENSGTVLEGQSLKKIVALEQERLKKLSEIGELTKFFFKDKLDYEPELLIWKKMSFEQVKKNLEKTEKILSQLKEKEFEREKIKSVLEPLAKERGSGEIFWPLRAALTGRPASPGPFEVAEVLGKEKTIKRIREAKELLK